MKYWLMKSEPDVFGIDDLERVGTEPWDGVRNYQARNFMRDDMKVGDKILFYHSNAKPPGVVGIAKVARTGYPDYTSWDPTSKYYDEKSSEENPRWFMVDVTFVKKLPRLVSLDELRAIPDLEGMPLVSKSRLSVQPVTKEQFQLIVNLAKK